MIKIILPGNPPSTQHIYMHKGHFVYMTKEGKDAKKRFQDEFLVQYGTKPLSGDLKLTVGYFWGDRRIRDIDNFSKLWMDAGTGYVWVDDSQIQELTLKKFYDKKFPRVEIEINETNAK